MTLDTQIRRQLDSAVADTAVPPGLAHAALAGGRRRRRHRAAAGLALVTAAVVGGVLLQPDPGPAAREDRVAGDTGPYAEGLSWARSLQQGAAPALPFFSNGLLWFEGKGLTVPGEVDQTIAPHALAGGWLVARDNRGGDGWSQRLAVLYDDGTLRDLPLPGPSAGSGETLLAVSEDGTRIALSGWLVDVATMDVAMLGKAPAEAEADGYVTEADPAGFIGDQLVYTGVPFDQGLGTTWLRRADGSEVAIDPPSGTEIGDGSPADLAVSYDHSNQDDTCTTTYRLVDVRWTAARTACMGQAMGEVLSVSPDGRWLLTNDLPRVWNLETGRFARLDIPDAGGRAQMDAQWGGAVWEGDDTFLLPVSDRWDQRVPVGQSYVHAVQVVRCTVSAGTCERAGEEHAVRATTTTYGSTDLRFARDR